MFIHQRTASKFLVQAWPSSGAGHFRLFNTPKLKTDLSVIVEHVAKALFDTNKAFVRHSTFSLVNVTSPIAKLSFGYQREPFEGIRRFHPLSFTFAFTRRDRYDSRFRPRFMVRPVPQVTFWGYSLIGNADFITINVPKRVMRRAGLLVPNMREMEWLYMAIGAFSKGFAKQFDYYTVHGLYRSKPVSHEIAKSKYYNARFQSLLKHVPYCYWGYSRDMWQLAPNFLSPRACNDDFLDYYCRYLSSEFYGKYRTPNVLDIERRAQKYLTPGVLAARSITGPIPDTGNRSLNTVLYLLGNNIDSLGHRTDTQGIVDDLLRGKFGGS